MISHYNYTNFIEKFGNKENNFWNPFLFNKKIVLSYENIFNLLKNFFINEIRNSDRYFRNYLYISGPKENGNIYIILFEIIIDLSNNYFNLSSMTKGKNRKTLDVKTNNKNMKTEEEKKYTCYLNSIEKTDFYSGKSIINMAKAIIYSLGFINIELEDQAFFICNRRNTFFNRRNQMTPYHEYPLSIIQILKYKKTYYQKFGFEPYDRNLQPLKDDLERILKDELFKKISWQDYIDYFSKINHTIQQIESGKNNIISKNLGGYQNFSKWKTFIKTIESKFNFLYENYSYTSSPFYSFTEMDDENCDKFIDFLELFEITHITYMKNNHKIYKENNIDTISIPGIKQIRLIKKIIDSSRFISYNFSL